MQLIQLVNENKDRLANGCILPDGQVAIAWSGDRKINGTFPSMETFAAVQARIPGRTIEDYRANRNEMRLGLNTQPFHLVCNDGPGDRGTYIVAVGCDFYLNGCVLQWLGELSSTFWYPDIETIKRMHCNHKTQVVIDEQSRRLEASREVNGEV